MKIFKDLKNELSEINLSEKNKNRIYDELVKRMEKTEDEFIPTPYFELTISPFATRLTKVMAFSLIFMLTIGTGLAQASQDALPGEALYSIKITTEDVVAATTKNTPEEKIDWEIERTERRMQEAAELAINDDLDQETQNVIIEKIGDHTEKIAEEIKKIEDENPEEALAAHSSLEISLQAHAEMLSLIKEDLAKEKEEVSGNEELEKIENLEENLEKIIAVAVVQEEEAKEAKEKAEETIVTEQVEKTDNKKILAARIGDLRSDIIETEHSLNEMRKEIDTMTIVTAEESMQEEDAQAVPESTPQMATEEAVTTEIVETDDIPEIVENTQVGERIDVDTEALKKEAEYLFTQEKYGESLIIYEDIYQYLLGQLKVVEIKIQIAKISSESQKLEEEISSYEEKVAEVEIIEPEEAEDLNSDQVKPPEEKEITEEVEVTETPKTEEVDIVSEEV